MADRSVLRAIPRELIVAIGLGSALYTARAIVDAAGGHDVLFSTRWHLFEYGVSAAETGLVLLGLVALWRRATDRLAVLLGIATVARALGMLWTLAWPMLNSLIFEGDREHIEYWFDVIGIGWFVIDVVAFAALIGAARPWLTRIGQVALALRVIAFVPQVPYLGPWIWGHFYDRSTWVYYQLAITLLSLAWLPLYGLIAQQLPDDAGPASAASACRRAAWSLYARIWLAIGIAGIAVGTIHDPAVASTLLYVTAIGTALALGGFVSGLVGLGQARLAGIPVLRLYIAAFVTLWWIAIQLDQAYLMHHGLAESLIGYEREDIAAWSVIGPLAMIAAVGFGASALSGLSSNSVGDFATSRIAMYITLGAAGALIPLVPFESPSGFVLMALGSIGCSIGSLVALARLFRDAAERVALASAADVF